MAPSLDATPHHDEAWAQPYPTGHLPTTTTPQGVSSDPSGSPLWTGAFQLTAFAGLLQLLPRPGAGHDPTGAVLQLQGQGVGMGVGVLVGQLQQQLPQLVGFQGRC